MRTRSWRALITPLLFAIAISSADTYSQEAGAAGASNRDAEILRIVTDPASSDEQRRQLSAAFELLTYEPMRSALVRSRLKHLDRFDSPEK